MIGSLGGGWLVGSLPLVFQQMAEFPITKNNQIGILQHLGLQFVISFQISFNTVPNGGDDSILHFTTGTDGGAYGQRIPGLWYYADKLYLSSAISGFGAVLIKGSEKGTIGTTEKTARND